MFHLTDVSWMTSGPYWQSCFPQRAGAFSFAWKSPLRVRAADIAPAEATAMAAGPVPVKAMAGAWILARAVVQVGAISLAGTVGQTLCLTLTCLVTVVGGRRWPASLTAQVGTRHDGLLGAHS